MMKNQNPQTKIIVAVDLILIIISLSLGASVYFIGANIGGIFIAAVGIGASLVIASREFWFRPKSIEFYDDGIELALSFGRRRTVQWNMISEIFSNEGDSKSVKGKLKRTGGIIESNRLVPIVLTYELAAKVKQEYFRRFGKYPPQNR
jgi:hypothetical protein